MRVNVRSIVSSGACLVFGLLPMLVGAAGAGKRDTTTVAPLAVGRGPVAAQVSTFSFFPQIAQIKPTKMREHPEEKGPPHLGPIPEPNSLVAGGLLNVRRATRGFAPKITFPGPPFTFDCPPDPCMAVNSRFIVATINTDIGFYDKQGNNLFLQNFFDFFAPVGATVFQSDPKVFWDPETDRFFVEILDVPSGFLGTGQDSHIEIGVSPAGTPIGVWNLYKIDTFLNESSTDLWSDYPGFGYNHDVVATSFNMFPVSTGSGFGVQVQLIRKADLIAGVAPLIAQFFNPDFAPIFTVQPAMTPSASNSDLMYGLSVDGTANSSNNLYVHKFINLDAFVGGTGNPGWQFSTFAVPFYTLAPFIIEADGNIVETLGDRLLNCYYRNIGGRDHLYGTHDIQIPTDPNRSMVRWYDLDPTLTFPSMAGDVPPDPNDPDQSLYMPAIIPDSLGDVGLIFTRSSKHIMADTMVTGRSIRDPAGTMGIPVKVVGSQSDFYECEPRWGDFFGGGVDPADGFTLWAISMTVDQTSAWKTYVTSWRAGSCFDIGDPFDATIIQVLNGQNVTGGLPQIQADDGDVMSIDSTNVKGGRAVTVLVRYGLPAAYTSADSLCIGERLIADAPAGVTYFLNLWNNRTGRWDPLRQRPMNGRAKIEIEVEHPADYISSSQEVRMLLRFFNPVRRTVGQPFTVAIDESTIFALKKA
ncbi:MAG: hypothetical protein HYR64_02815 [Fimbriimonas ginsengisoli]|uniref:DUF2961 domain-containing protein n=1 Tax=Fimbriimonas ginsengisoli TaxID=1005039 RepID=A0A931LRK0_FIMGI|nr:hypothetical protein [Fimbriimonas ginsengisoli]